MPADQPAPPNPKLRWYQYRLRTLFLITFLVAVAYSWLAVKIEQAQKQKKAADALRKNGTNVLVAYDYETDSSGARNYGATPPGPAWLRNWLGDDFFGTVTGVSILPLGKSASKPDLKPLEDLTHLKELPLCTGAITADDLVHLEGLFQLNYLNLEENQITGDGLKHLKRLDMNRASKSWCRLRGVSAERPFQEFSPRPGDFQ
jgi:hypothetical protein